MKKLSFSFFLLVGISNMIHGLDFNDIINKYPSMLDKYPWMQNNGWVDIQNVCKLKNEIFERNIDCVNTKFTGTENSLLPDWAGEITYIYYDKDKLGFSSSPFKFFITWRTNDSKHSCGETIILDNSKIKDFNFRSLAMKKCY